MTRVTEVLSLRVFPASYSFFHSGPDILVSKLLSSPPNYNFPLRQKACDLTTEKWWNNISEWGTLRFQFLEWKREVRQAYREMNDSKS